MTLVNPAAVPPLATPTLDKCDRCGQGVKAAVIWEHEHGWVLHLCGNHTKLNRAALEAAGWKVAYVSPNVVIQ